MRTVGELVLVGSYYSKALVFFSPWPLQQIPAIYCIYPLFFFSILSIIYLSIYFIVLSIFLSIYQSMFLSIYQSIHLSVYPSIYLSIYPYLHLSIYMSSISSILTSFYIHIRYQIPRYFVCQIFLVSTRPKKPCSEDLLYLFGILSKSKYVRYIDPVCVVYRFFFPMQIRHVYKHIRKIETFQNHLVVSHSLYRHINRTHKWNISFLFLCR